MSMNQPRQLALAALILVSVFVGGPVLSVHASGAGEAAAHSAVPDVVYAGNASNASNVSLSGIAAMIWDAIWPSVSGTAHYFEAVVGVLFNDTMIWFNMVMTTWTGSVSGFGIWSVPFLAVILGVTVIGVSLTLTVGDAAKDVMEG